jgi:hypothetical protein
VWERCVINLDTSLPNGWDDKDQSLGEVYHKMVCCWNLEGSRCYVKWINM